ncbi:MAG: hypothetical protein K0Q49_1653 [Haloplasmataceae bacterium]|jgi:hypothetical protein|nr:hypothetical protein [Haloplasmataceae bacterium]
MWVFLIWIASMIGAPIYAKKKGSSALGWFLAMFIFGWIPYYIGLICIVIGWIALLAMAYKD